MTSDETIDLLDKHADKAMEYLKMNRGTGEDTDLDTRTVIWNQMSALLSDAARIALEPAPPRENPAADSGLWCAECQAPVCDHVARRLACDCVGTGLPHRDPAPPREPVARRRCGDCGHEVHGIGACLEACLCPGGLAPSEECGVPVHSPDGIEVGLCHHMTGHGGPHECGTGRATKGEG